jgi:hypothetical protein
LNTVIPLPWQRLVPEWCDCNYQNSWTVKEYCSLFIDTGHSLWRITIMPLIKVYNIDSNPYGLKGHSIFKSVCDTEASWRETFGHPIQTASAENRFFLQDLRWRSIVPTGAKSAEVCPGLAHRTVRCATGQCLVHQGLQLWTAHLREFWRLVRYNSPDCPV